jgi:polysaccharide deacetylase 2 family uncharacterized protein YibQ
MPIKPKKITASSSSISSFRRTNEMSDLRKSIVIVLGFFLLLLFLGIGYILSDEGEDNKEAQAQGYQTAKEYSIGELLNDLAIIKENEIEEEAKKEVVVASATLVEEKVVVAQSVPKTQTPKETPVKETNNKPKLSIIMDDISKKRQLVKLQNLGMNITPSIFPPSELSMSSHTLAEGLEHYMIHLPMQSSSEKLNKHYKTLKITATKAEIIARAKELRKLFPKGVYINNHTGSVFAGNYNAMSILYKALRGEGFLFVDSKTGSDGKILKISSEFSDKYVARDVFIDNVQKISSIQEQLKKAVKIAKSKGHAIVIGHPHKTTFEALENSKELLAEVELVYIDTVYKK